MTAVAAAPATVPATRIPLPPPGRLGAWLAVLALPAWIASFIALTIGFGVKTQEQAVFTPAEQAAQYHENLGGAWVFGIVSVLAIALLGLAPALLALAIGRLGRFRVLAATVVLLAAVTLVVEIVVEGSYFGLLLSPPDALPGWLIALAGADTNTALNAIGWGAIDIAVPLVALLLSRGRVLPRTGLVVAIVGGVVLVVGAVFLFFQPMVPAVLLLGLGIPLLRHRK